MSQTPLQQNILTVDDAWAGKRLDVYLTAQIPDISRTQVRRLIEDGQVVPQFKIKAVKPSFPVETGQTFVVTIPPLEASPILPQAFDLDIVFEDDDLLVINKPVGMVVHPGAGNPDHTLINALMAHCPQIQGVGGVNRPGLVHRLDKDTSGLLVAAKSDLAFRSLVRELKSRNLSRIYLGLVRGVLDEKGKIDVAVGRHPEVRNKMGVLPEGGKPAITHFETLQASPAASLLMFKLETGRTHQIRVHMNFIKHPILGDGVYGGESEKASRQMLHAFRLSFKHPRTKEKMDFFTPPPEDFAECAKALGLLIPRWKDLDWEKKEIIKRKTRKKEKA